MSSKSAFSNSTIILVFSYLMELRIKMLSYVILACKKSRPRNHSWGSRPVTQYQNLVELHYHCHHKHHNHHQYHHFHLDWLPPPPITKMTPSTPHLCQIWWREVVASHQETSCAVRKHHRDTAMAVAGLEVATKLKFRILKHWSAWSHKWDQFFLIVCILKPFEVLSPTSNLPPQYKSEILFLYYVFIMKIIQGDIITN